MIDINNPSVCFINFDLRTGPNDHFMRTDVEDLRYITFLSQGLHYHHLKPLLN